MKKIVLFLAAVLGFMSMQAQHVEFKWHRMYYVAGYDFSTNINKTDYNDHATLHGFYAIGGWQIRKESGLGLGVEYLRDFTGAFSQLPVFIEVRSHYLRNQVTPYTSVYVGYTIPLGSSSGGDNAVSIAQGGPTWGFNVGARYAFSRKMGISLFLGYQGIYLERVERKVDGLLANARPQLFQNFKAGIGFNF